MQKAFFITPVRCKSICCQSKEWCLDFLLTLLIQMFYSYSLDGFKNDFNEQQIAIAEWNILS